MYVLEFWQEGRWVVAEKITAPSRRKARKRVNNDDLSGRHWRLRAG